MDTEIISSRTNELVKKIKKLGERKYREKFGEYVAEGKRWVTDASRLCPQDISATVRAQSCDYAAADFVLTDELFAEIAGTENSQGILAVMKIPEAASEFSSDAVLLLDRIRDPGNMGTIIRTAVAAGYRDIIANNCVDIYNPKVIRSSMTGILNINFAFDCDISAIKASGYRLIAADMAGESVFSHKIPNGKLCLVIGNEANGVSDDILSECDCKVSIPMEKGIESLNAAVSAGILMYELKFKNN